jgi:rod shape-determining protein MreC
MKNVSPRLSLTDLFKLGFFLLAQVRYVLMVLTCIGLILLFNAENKFSQSLRDNLSSHVGNAYALLVSPLHATAQLPKYIGSYFLAIDENRKLKARLEQITIEMEKFKIEAEETARLKQQLNLFDSSRKNTLTARIFSTQDTGQEKMLSLGLGSAAGIKISDVAFHNNSVIGKVIKTSANTALIQSIMDSNSKIPAITSRGSHKMIVLGTGIGSYLSAVLYNSLDLPEAGDLVITSGDGGIYPYGLIIGEVVLQGNKVLVKPSLETADIHYATVLLN